MSTDEFSFDHPENQTNNKWTRLLPLSQSDPKFLAVEKQFIKNWKHPKKPKPRVHAVYKILSSEASLKPFHQYRERVSQTPSLSSKSKNLNNPANEQLLYHGTNRSCLLGEDNARVRLCPRTDCRLCSVIRKSYDIKKCGSKNKFRRFGTGIYTTSCSSKANDYAMNVDQNSSLKVVLVNRVIVGKPYKRRVNATNLDEPPCGHHSVIGEPGIDLNYEETVVYTNDAIRPAYLIVYGESLEAPSKLHTLVSVLFKTPLAS